MVQYADYKLGGTCFRYNLSNISNIKFLCKNYPNLVEKYKIHEINKNFYKILEITYDYLIAYREALREANINTINSTTANVQKIFQTLCLYYEKNFFKLKRREK